jgi:PTH1 family peptidyl-tRNA hydrolase
MKLVVGLGNPGRQYTGTRHNVGYEVLAELARRWAAEDRPRVQFSGETVNATISGVKVLLLSPTTYMNRSGTSVRAAVDFYKLNLHDILIICDDMNLPLGKLRFRSRGSSGGHKGLADIIRALGTEEIPRLRIGIGKPPGGQDSVRFVLSHFGKEEVPVIQKACRKAADAIEIWVTQGIEACMSQFN